MKLSTGVLNALSIVSASAYARPQAEPANPHEWIKGGPNDARGPCPMLNTLANHGYIPRDGRNITRENAVSAFNKALNFKESFGSTLFDNGIIANPEPNATFFTLQQLQVHNLIEHDASLSRPDSGLGNNWIFNQTVFDQSRQWWTEEKITPKHFAHSKIFRQIQSRATNPKYTYSQVTQDRSLQEAGVLIVVFGDIPGANVRRDFIEYFFQNERLPTELGWQKQANEVSLETHLAMAGVVGNATVLITSDGVTGTKPS